MGFLCKFYVILKYHFEISFWSVINNQIIYYKIKMINKPILKQEINNKTSKGIYIPEIYIQSLNCKVNQITFSFV